MKKMVGGFSRLSNHFSSVVFSGGRLEGLPLRAIFSPAHPRQIFFTRPTLRLLRNRFPGTCHHPGRGPSNPLFLYDSL